MKYSELTLEQQNRLQENIASGLCITKREAEECLRKIDVEVNVNKGEIYVGISHTKAFLKLLIKTALI